MSDFIDRLRGIDHFLFDKTPRNLLVVQPKKGPNNTQNNNGRMFVAKIRAEANLKEDIKKVVSQVGPISQIISRGDKVLVKPNYNSPDPPPASTDIAFLRALIEILLEAGAKVSVGDSSGALWRPTDNVFRKIQLYQLGKELNVPLIAFEDKDNEWVKIKMDGRYLKSVTVPRVAYEADKLVYLPCLKTHGLAEFSGALKLAFGFVHPGERRGFHFGHLQEKLAEVNLCWQPNLIVMDGRKAFVSGGPNHGQIAQPGVILASRNPVAIDIEAVKILILNGARNLPANPWKLPQIARAVAVGLGDKASP
jgi:uncharacterized protein (DUF362 family)